MELCGSPCVVFCCFPTPAIPACRGSSLPPPPALSTTCLLFHTCQERGGAVAQLASLCGASSGLPHPSLFCGPCPGLTICTPSTVTPNLAAQLGAGPARPLSSLAGEAWEGWGWVPTGSIGWPQSHRPGPGPLQEETEMATKCKCSASGPTSLPSAGVAPAGCASSAWLCSAAGSTLTWGRRARGTPEFWSHISPCVGVGPQGCWLDS